MTTPPLIACEAVHRVPDGEVRLLGAVDCVTGAMTRVELGGKAFLVDCGITQGRDAHRWSFPDAARDADALLLTHGHLDHIGSVPALLEGGWDGPIFGTHATIRIARLSLEDSLSMDRASRRDVKGFLDRFDSLTRAIHYDLVGEPLKGQGVTASFREAGHILGSSSVELRSAASRVIVSGDLGRPDSPLLRDPNTRWDDDRPVDLVVMESTYGSRDHAHSHEDIERDLERILKDAVAAGGHVLVPAFAIGRTQTLLWFLNKLVEERRIPEVPVVIDTPMGFAVTETYEANRALFDRESLDRIARGDDPLDFESLFVARKGQDSARVMKSPGPLVIIAGSGMCTGGRIVRHLAAGLPDPSTTVLFVGHQAEGTPGRRIQQAAKSGGKVYVDGEEVEVRARIETLKGLSAHADRGELMAWLGHIPNVRRVALHHGEAESQRALVAYRDET